MRKALAILATVATVGATAAPAPAQARGWGWGGQGSALVWPRARWRREPTGYMDLTVTTGRATDITATVRVTTDLRITAIIAARITDPDMGPMPIMVMAGRIIGTAIGGTGNEQPGASLRALHGPAPACDLSPADC
jgi:hypothetical protein